MTANPGVSIDIQGGGTSVGVTSAGDGTVDIGNASRDITSDEMTQYPNLKVFTIAYDGIAIIVNPDVNLTNLSTEQVRNIFSGKVKNFSEVGGSDGAITVVSREEGSGTRTAFEDLVMTYKDTSGTKQTDPIVDSALLQQSNGQLLTVVSTTPNAIGFLSLGFLDSSVKAVAIDNVEPSVANIKNGSYKIFRPFNMLTNGDPSPLAKAFIDYIMGADGQAVVAKDYITITK
jgi:phosphate transport system substrate-binding protein